MNGRQLLATLRELVLGNVLYKVVSFAFALMVWTWVQSEQVVEERARVRLEWRFPEGLTPVEPVLETATVSVEGVQAFVRTVRQKELSIVVDLSRAKEGEVNLDLSERPVIGLPPQVRVAGLAPASLKLELDRVQKRRLNVAAATRGDVAEGYRLAAVRVSPDRVELSGPSSVLKALAEVSTDPVDVSGLREDAEFDVGLNITRGQVAPTIPVRFVVEVDVEPVIRERLFEGVPVVVRDERYTSGVPTVSVSVSGPADRIDGIDPDAVSLMVYVPDGYDGEGGAARMGKEGGLRYEVVQPGGEEVRVLQVAPSAIPVSRR